jgi:2'-5' RNA ligase
VSGAAPTQPLRRLFFALWPAAALRAAIVAAAAPVTGNTGDRKVPAENLHVTLAFLGGVADARVAPALHAARGIDAAAGTQRFDAFARWGRGGPIVLETTHVAPALRELREALASSLLAADFALDRRDFRPHITLARDAGRGAPPEALPPGPVPPIDWPFESFALVESTPVLRDGRAVGSRYHVLGTVPLRTP